MYLFKKLKPFNISYYLLAVTYILQNIKIKLQCNKRLINNKLFISTTSKDILMRVNRFKN